MEREITYYIVINQSSYRANFKMFHSQSVKEESFNQTSPSKIKPIGMPMYNENILGAQLTEL